MRTEPSQQTPCSSDRLEYECRVLTPSDALLWTLPPGDSLQAFTAVSPIGAVRSSGVYRATLTGVMEEPPGSEKLIFTSTLFIMNTANNSDVSCIGHIVGEDDDVVNTTTIALSGT